MRASFVHGMRPPVVQPLDERRGQNGYMQSDYKRTPWNIHMRRHLWNVRRNRLLVKIMRDDMRSKGQRV